MLSKFAFITITFTANNVFFNLSTSRGKTIKVLTAGGVGFFKLKRKNTVIIQSLLTKLLPIIHKKKISNICLHLRNTGFLSKKIMKIFLKSKINISRIRDVTPVSHNGCRPRKKKRR